MNRISLALVLSLLFSQAPFAMAQLPWETVTQRPGKTERRTMRRGAVHALDGTSGRIGERSSGYTVVRMSGPATNRVNFVFIGDGFRVDEMAAWAAHVDLMVSQLLGSEPYDRYANFLNIYRIDLASAESGVDDPANGIFVDTALDGCACCIDFTIGQCQVDWAKTFAAINQAMPGIDVHWRAIVLNTSIFLGGAHYPPEGNLAVYPSNNPDSFYVLRHAGAHAFHLLGDEYFYPEYAENVYRGGEPGWVNLTTDPTAAKWAVWHGYAQPANGGSVGAYEGGMVTFGKGIWRPSSLSAMNGDWPLDAIGKERAIHSIYDLVDPIDAWGPRGAEVPPDSVLWVDVIDPAVLLVEWFVDGELAGTGSTLDLTSLPLDVGTHAIEARVHDEVLDYAFSDNSNPHALDLVRRDQDKLRQVVTWSVGVPVFLPTTSTYGLLVFALLIAASASIILRRSAYLPDQPN